MMEYIPGQIHEKLQNEFFFLINSDYVWSNCGHRGLKHWDWDKTRWKINLVKGDVILVRFFKSSLIHEPYAYLEKVWSDGGVVEYKTESIISLGIIQTNPFLFTDITKSFERDKKIESLLC